MVYCLLKEIVVIILTRINAGFIQNLEISREMETGEMRENGTRNETQGKHGNLSRNLDLASFVKLREISWNLEIQIELFFSLCFIKFECILVYLKNRVRLPLRPLPFFRPVK